MTENFFYNARKLHQCFRCLTCNKQLTYQQFVEHFKDCHNHVHLFDGDDVKTVRVTLDKMKLEAFCRVRLSGGVLWELWVFTELQEGMFFWGK